MKVIIIGTGRMGFAQARILRFFGDEILCAFDINAEKSAMFAKEFGVPILADIADCLRYKPDLIFVTVNDDSIESVAEKLEDVSSECVVMHTSGALSSDILSRHIHASCASYHPLMSCPLFSVSDEVCVEAYRGVVHCVEGDEAAVSLAGRMIERLGGECVQIKTSSKAAYHAAAVFASNYPVVLIDAAVHILMECGFSCEQAKLASLRLLNQASRSMESAAPVDALTGPAKRRDNKTIQMHRGALGENADLLNLYNVLYHAANRMCGYTD